MDSASAIRGPSGIGSNLEIVIPSETGIATVAPGVLTDITVINGNQRNLLEIQPAATGRGKKKAIVAPPGFLAFWKIYPRKIAKRKALEAWHTMGAEPLSATIIAAIRAQAPEFLARPFEKVPLDKVPHAASWLHGERWEDEVIAAPNGHQKSPQTEGMLARARASGPELDEY